MAHAAAALSAGRTTLLTLLVGLVATALVTYVFFGSKPEGKRSSGPGPVFPGMELADVRRLTVERGVEKLLIERAPAPPATKQPAAHEAAASDGGAPQRGAPRGAHTRAAVYKILEPRRLEADDEAIHALLSRMAKLSCRRELDDAGAPGSYGLSAPRVVIEAFTGTGVRRIELGVADGFGGGVFARVPVLEGTGTRVVVISEEDARALDRGLQDLREHRLLRASFERATAVRIDVGRTRTSLLRTETGEWSLMGLGPADEPGVRALLDALSRLHALRYLDEGKPRAIAAHGLEPPDVRVRIDLGGTAYRVALSKRPTGTIVAVDLAGGPVGEIAFPLWQSLVRAPRAWRSPSALRFDRKRVGTLRWSRKGALVMVSRMKDGSWQSLAPAPGIADDRAVNALLGTLEKLAAHDPDDTPRDLTAYGLASAPLEVAIDDMRGARIDGLHVGNRTGERRYARNVRWGGVFKVDTAALELLETAKVSVKKDAIDGGAM